MHLKPMNTIEDTLSLVPRIRRASMNATRRHRLQAGSSLLEALVAMLVLSIGLLGIAGLASASLRYSQGSWARAAVASGLSDLADRVRANPSASETDYRFNAITYEEQREDIEGGEVAIARDCLAEGCTPTQLAAYHLTDWRLALNRSMPGAAVWVSGQRSTGYLATVMWYDKNFVKDDGVTPEESPTCEVNAAGVITDTGIAARVCCPAAADVIDGVRCTNMSVIP